jgi:hypothetical protein
MKNTKDHDTFILQDEIALSIGIEPIYNHWESKNAENTRWDN